MMKKTVKNTEEYRCVVEVKIKKPKFKKDVQGGFGNRACVSDCSGYRLVVKACRRMSEKRGPKGNARGKVKM